MPSSRPLGLLALADRSSGGIYQYTQSMIDALHAAGEKDWVIFTSHEVYRTYGFKVKPLEVKTAGGAVDHMKRAVAALLGIRIKSFIGVEAANAISECELLVSPTASLLPFWSGVPFFVTIHDFQERYYPGYFARLERIRRYLTNRVCGRFSEKVLCESIHVKSDIVRFTGIPSDKVLVIQAPPRLLGPTEMQSRSDIAGRFLFYPAQLWPHKNHIVLFKALVNLRRRHLDLKLFITGDANRYQRELLPHVRELGLEDAVVCLGYLSDDDLAQAYAHASAVVVPSLFESISIPVFEAFQYGVPICASNLLALPEQVGDAGVLFDPNSPNDIAEKVAKVLDDEKFRAELIRRGKERIKSFDLEKYGRNLCEAFRADRELS